MNIMQLDWNTSHVKGHQNDTKSEHELSWEEKLNIRADIIATKAKDRLVRGKMSAQTVAMPHSRINLFINDTIITKKFDTAIYRAWSTRALRKYL